MSTSQASQSHPRPDAAVTPEPVGGVWHEAMRPAWWWWLVAVALWLSVTVAVWAYLGWAWALGATLAVAALTGTFIVQQGLVVRADDQAFRVGRNRIEWRWISGVRALDATATERRLADASHHTDFLAVRSYVPTAIVLILADPADPHPHWVVSTRRPEALARFVTARLGATATADDRGGWAGDR